LLKIRIVQSVVERSSTVAGLCEAGQRACPMRNSESMSFFEGGRNPASQRPATEDAGVLRDHSVQSAAATKQLQQNLRPVQLSAGDCPS